MKIARYVGELLFDYECVVIPGLGGFIAEDRSVKINKVTDKFSPPYRKIHFNLHLIANDGLLVNFVAAEENITYKVAKQRVDKFVFLCHKALDQGKKINFKHIGSIFFDEDKNIVFKQDETINYNADSFGLTSLVSPSVRRATDEEKIKKVVKSAIDRTRQKEKTAKRVDEKPDIKKERSNYKMQATRRPNPIRNQIIFLLVIAFMMGIGYTYMRRDAMMYYFDKYSSRIPLFYSNVNEYLADNINSVPVAKLSKGTASFFPIVLDNDSQPESIENDLVLVVENDSAVATGDVVPNDEPVVVEIEPENTPLESEDVRDDDPIMDPIKKDDAVKDEKIVVPDVKPAASSDNFFIIAGSFSSEANAKGFVQELNQKGFNAFIADTNRYGMYRVSLMSFSSRKAANQKLMAIRKEASPKAWLLIK